MGTEGSASFLQLEDAARQPGCLLCALISSRMRRRAELLLYEGVNDVGFRDQWRAAAGFCHRHAWMLAEPRDALGMAILYLDLYESHGEGLAERPAGKPCRWCEEEESLLKLAVDEMRQRWSEPEFAGAVQDSEGLCLPHLRALRDCLKTGPILNVLTAATLRAVRQMPSDLHKLIDSFDYQSAPAVEPRVKDAWRRAVERLVGCRDVPGTR